MTAPRALKMCRFNGYVRHEERQGGPEREEDLDRPAQVKHVVSEAQKNLRHPVRHRMKRDSPPYSALIRQHAIYETGIYRGKDRGLFHAVVSPNVSCFHTIMQIEVVAALYWLI